MTERHLPLIEPETLPPRLATWAGWLLGGPIPREEHATCESCAMVSQNEGPDGISFNPLVKCCTYLPEVPNFSVGAILREPGARHGHESVRRRIAQRMSVTPLGVGQPPLDRDPRSKPPVFGRDVAYLCDHYDGGCSIWAHRGSVCATYFCKYGRGEVGLRFWGALHGALAVIERAVARGCAIGAGLSDRALAALARLPASTSVLPVAVMDDATYDALWGEFVGREEAFFIESARAADAFTWEDIERLGGAELSVAAAAARHTYRELVTPSMPQRPACKSFTIRPSGPDRVLVVGYSQVDPIALAPAVVAALAHFDGRPRAQALQAARERERVALSEDLVQMLADFGVLEEQDE